METLVITRLLNAKLELEPEIEIERICGFIRDEVKRRSKRGVVLGLSGGLDSTTCAYLCARCLKPEQIHLYSLPERDSGSSIHAQAEAVARTLNLELHERNLLDLFSQLGLYEQVPSDLAGNRKLLERSISLLGRLSNSPALYPWAQEYAFRSRHGILAGLMRRRLWTQASSTEKFIFGKLRARMLVLSLQAIQQDCLLICTTDRSEWSVGFYDPHGDGVGDLAPLRHLYKTQIRNLARELGVSEDVLQQPSSGDLAASLPNETAIGLPYEVLDRVLAGIGLGMKDEETALGAGVQRSMVKALRSACDLADERRRMPATLES